MKKRLAIQSSADLEVKLILITQGSTLTLSKEKDLAISGDTKLTGTH